MYSLNQLQCLYRFETYEQAWSIGNEWMQFEQVYDMKDQVNNLAVANSISCFIPQGPGIKVGNASSIYLNFSSCQEIMRSSILFPLGALLEWSI